MSNHKKPHAWSWENSAPDPTRNGRVFACPDCGATVFVGAMDTNGPDWANNGECPGEDHFARAFPGERRPE